MEDELVLTSWRGMEVRHPAEWELSRASGHQEPGRLGFADRYHHRLDVRWKPVGYLPDLKLVLVRHAERKDKDSPAESIDLAGAPEGWQGVIRRVEEGQIVHAARFDRRLRWLIEVTIVWPERRDRDLEGSLLAGIACADPDAARRLWQAGGLSVVLDRAFDLFRVSANVGQERWEFRRKAKGGPRLIVQRLAMPDRFLRARGLCGWIRDDVPRRDRVLREERAEFNRHPAERLLSRRWAGTVAALRGRRTVQVDLAWLCPAENRAYRISWSRLQRGEELPLPEGLAVRCCQPAPPV